MVSIIQRFLEDSIEVEFGRGIPFGLAMSPQSFRLQFTSISLRKRILLLIAISPLIEECVFFVSINCLRY